MATPLTYSEHIGAVQGGAYGPAMTPSQWGPFRFGTTTPVRGLLLAGAGAIGSGVAPCLLSGKLCALAAQRTREDRLAPFGARLL